VIERVEPNYSLDALYPPLIEFGGILQKCAYTYSMHSKENEIWWGDFHAEFRIDLSGKVDPISYNPLYPGAAYMKKFIDCVSVPFKALTFATPLGGKSVKANVSIHFPYSDLP